MEECETNILETIRHDLVDYCMQNNQSLEEFDKRLVEKRVRERTNAII